MDWMPIIFGAAVAVSFTLGFERGFGKAIDQTFMLMTKPEQSEMMRRLEEMAKRIRGHK